MINFYTGIPSWKRLEMFISLVKPCADKIKTWSQEQQNRVKQNKDIPVAVNHDTNYAFLSTLCTEDQLFLFLSKIKLGLFEQDLAEVSNLYFYSKQNFSHMDNLSLFPTGFLAHLAKHGASKQDHAKVISRCFSHS